MAGKAGGPGFADGTGTAALFNNPNGIAVDGSGNVYVADVGNQVIRKITPTGIVSTLAGKVGTSGYADGTGTAALFSYPILGYIVDGNGTVYVADSNNSVIRKITPAGVVSTLAGKAGTYSFGQQTYADGTGTAASVDGPNGVAVDSGGNVYVADTVNSVIRKITPTGVVTTLAGMKLTPRQYRLGGILHPGTFADGPGASAEFLNPTALTVDLSGNVYVTDSGNAMIREISPSGSVTTLAGMTSPYTTHNMFGLPNGGGVVGYADGTGTIARFGYPWGIAVDATGNLYIADTNNNAIRKGLPSAGPLTTNTALAAAVSVDNHNSGDTITVLPGATASVTVRFKATDSANPLVGIRYNSWNPPSGSLSELQGYTTYTGSGNPLQPTFPNPEVPVRSTRISR